MSTPAHEDERRRRGFVLALVGGVLLLALGLTGGWVAFGGDSLSGSQSPSLGSGVTVILPTAQAAAKPASSPAVATSQAQPVTQGNNGNGGGAGNPGHPLDVSGVVAGSLGPGTPARLVVTVRNPNNQDVILTSVTGAISSVTTAGMPGKPACSASWYHVGSFTGSRTIAKNSSTSVDLSVTFDDLTSVNQDNCKGARYTYSFTAQARQA